MEQEMIGKFISACRKEKGLTQMQLAEKLNITNRAVSKWETGKSMPDVSLMLDLCNILGITVNELLSGERIIMEDYQKRAEENLMELQAKKEKAQGELNSIFEALNPEISRVKPSRCRSSQEANGSPTLFSAS